jgi:hypothetical protein
MLLWGKYVSNFVGCGEQTSLSIVEEFSWILQAERNKEVVCPSF